MLSNLKCPSMFSVGQLSYLYHDNNSDVYKPEKSVVVTFDNFFLHCHVNIDIYYYSKKYD